MNRVENKKKICLSMIVKNESKIIERCMTSCLPILDYICICDTGSTDDTVEIIENFCKTHNIRGKVHKQEWKNFGYNRTLAYNSARETFPDADYCLLIDADMVLKIEPEFDKNSLNSGGYLVAQQGGNLFYYNTRLLSTKYNYKCLGVTHEYWSPEDHRCKQEQLDTLIYLDYGDGGSKSDKFERDIRLLTQGLIDEPKNERYMFYLAQSYHDIGKYKEAIHWYNKRIRMGSWYEEVYYSYYRIARCKLGMNRSWDEVEQAYEEAWKYLPSRMEPLYEIGKYYQETEQYEKAYKWLIKASVIPFPKNQVLFIYKDVYEYSVWDSLGIAAFYVGEYKIAIDSCVKALKSQFCDDRNSKRIKNNMRFSIEKLRDIPNNPNIQKKKKIVFYLGYSVFNEAHTYGSELACINLCKEFSKTYDVYVFGKSLTDTTFENIPFLNSSNLIKFMNENEIEVLIISRYIHYFIEYPLKAKYIYIWLHDVCYQSAYNGSYMPEQGKHLVNNVINNISKIVTLSSWHKDLVTKTNELENDKTCIIGNGVNKDLFQKYTQFDTVVKEKIPYRFIYTSDVCRGLEQLVDYFIDIQKEFPDAELYIYRDINSFDKYPELLKKIKSLDYIHYGGKLEQKDLVEKFIESEIWLYPTSFSETYCMSGLEALRSGCYCITTNLAALKDTIGNCGILINGDPRDNNIKKEFLQAVREALTNEKMRRELQEKGFDWAKTQTWENVCKEWLNLIEKAE